MKPRWLDRDTVRAPHLMLCLSEKEYLGAVAHCRIKDPSSWLDEERQTAAVHTWERLGALTCIVCLNPLAQKELGVAGVLSALVHEAVHIFQSLCTSIGEDRPSPEFEAYSIERIAGELIKEYVRRTGKLVLKGAA